MAATSLIPCPFFIGGEWLQPKLAGTPVFNLSVGCFFGNLHMQGKEGIQFFTQQKVTTSRWFSYGEGDVWHK